MSSPVPLGLIGSLNLLGLVWGLKVLGQGLTIIRRGRIIKAVYFDYFVLSFHKIYLLTGIPSTLGWTWIARVDLLDLARRMLSKTPVWMAMPERSPILPRTRAVRRGLATVGAGAGAGAGAGDGAGAGPGDPRGSQGCEPAE